MVRLAMMGSEKILNETFSRAVAQESTDELQTELSFSVVDANVEEPEFEWVQLHSLKF